MNEQILAYLKARQNEFTRLVEADSLVHNELALLRAVDIPAMTQQFVDEIGKTAQAWWPLLDTTNPIDALLFEYDALHCPDPTAGLYGLRFDNPTDLRIQTKPYSIGWRYTMPLEGLPGITLRLFNWLERDMPTTFPETVEYLRDAYLFTAFVALHHAIIAVAQTDAFQALHRRHPFHVLIQEHDTELTYPVYLEETYG